MKKKFLAGLGTGLFLVGMVGMANATTIDFNTIATGPVSSIGDATFSLAGVGEQGTPSTSVLSGEGYLWNSVDSYAYPTNSILRVDFSSMVTDLEVDFNNWGSSTSTWTLFNDIGTSLSSGAVIADASLHTYDFTSVSNVAAIEFNNLGNNWSFGISEIRYETAPVPEPATMLLFGTGLAGLVGIRRKKKIITKR